MKPKKLRYQDCISNEALTEEFAVSALGASLDLLNPLVELWTHLPSCAEILHQLKSQLVPNLPTQKLHPDLVKKVENIRSQLEKIQPLTTRSHTMPKRKKEIKMLKLYDPDLDDK